MPRKNTYGEGAKHTPGVNDGLPSNPVAVARYERARAEAKQAQIEALELRRSGYSYREIARLQGCSVNTANSRVRKAISKAIPQELIDSTRAIELDRIDQMTLMNLALMEKAFREGNNDLYLKVQDRVNALHDRRARIVPIQQPTKLVIDQQVTTQTDQDRELSELIGQAADKMQQKLDKLNGVHEQTFGLNE